MRSSRALVLAVLCLISPWACAQPAPGKAEAARVDPKAEGKPEAKDEKKDDKKADKLKASVTKGKVSIGGKEISYTATAGLTELPDYEGKPKAHVFSVSYVKDRDESDREARPLLIAFNGGPGSSSVWLHLGALGPRRVRFAEANEPAREASTPKPPYTLVDNEQSWLDLADLVFVDPVSTGYSRAVEGENPHQFHGLEEDVRAMADFIRLWVTKNRRWDSPIYLAGESYGTTRASGLSSYLQRNQGIYLSGIVLISPVLNFQTLEFDAGNDTAYWLFLPGYAATAWYHQRLEPALQQKPVADVVREAEAWARSEYLVALAKGAALGGEERSKVVAKLARYTGLSPEYIERSDLRVPMGRFGKELLRDQRRTIGRLDSRYVGIVRDGAEDSFEADPSYSAILGAFSSAMNQHVRSTLNYENDAPYEILTGRVHPWSFGSATNRYANVSQSLRDAIVENPSLRVLFCSGYYDLATPPAAATYTIEHLGLDATLRGNVSQTFYESGHMMYIRHADLVKLKKDVAAFMAAGGEPRR